MTFVWWQFVLMTFCVIFCWWHFVCRPFVLAPSGAVKSTRDFLTALSWLVISSSSWTCCYWGITFSTNCLQKSLFCADFQDAFIPILFCLRSDWIVPVYVIRPTDLFHLLCGSLIIACSSLEYSMLGTDCTMIFSDYNYYQWNATLSCPPINFFIKSCMICMLF